MADLRCEIAGVKSPNPFWLASAPPTDKAYNVVRAYKAGWGGVVWKTLGEDPPVVNTTSRYGAVHYRGLRMADARSKPPWRRRRKRIVAGAPSETPRTCSKTGRSRCQPIPAPGS